MRNEENIWLVPENDKEIDDFLSLIGNSEEYSKISIYYKELKELLILDYIQIGYKGEYEEVLGFLKLNGYRFSVENFKPVITLDNKYFKSFFKYLTKDKKLKRDSIITFYYSKNKHIVFVEVENKIGVIAICVEVI